MLAVVSIFSYQEQVSRVIADTVTDQDTVDVTAVVVDPNAQNGGGSTGSQTNPSNSVTLSGYAFPSAKLTLLKDGQIATTLVANSDGTFRVIVNNLNFGSYQFAIYAEDRDHVVSSPYVVNVSVTSSRGYSFGNIIIPPTISADPTVAAPNQPVAVYGYAPIGSTVSVEVPGFYNFGSAIADAQGFYRYEVRADLTDGDYLFRSRAQLGETFSLFSKPVSVRYYTGSQLPPPPGPYAACVDYNRDRRVNLIDFSILLFWFGKADPPPNIDCNGDKQINIQDFSILMYFWTG